MNVVWIWCSAFWRSCSSIENQYITFFVKCCLLRKGLGFFSPLLTVVIFFCLGSAGNSHVEEQYSKRGNKNCSQCNSYGCQACSVVAETYLGSPRSLSSATIGQVWGEQSRDENMNIALRATSLLTPFVVATAWCELAFKSIRVAKSWNSGDKDDLSVQVITFSAVTRSAQACIAVHFIWF